MWYCQDNIHIYFFVGFSKWRHFFSITSGGKKRKSFLSQICQILVLILKTKKLNPHFSHQKIHAHTNTEHVFFVLASDSSSVTVHSRSGEWPSRSRRAILVPADDQVSSTDRCCCCQPLTANKTPLDILTLCWGQGMKFNCRGLTRGTESLRLCAFFCKGASLLPRVHSAAWHNSDELNEFRLECEGFIEEDNTRSNKQKKHSDIFLKHHSGEISRYK